MANIQVLRQEVATIDKDITQPTFGGILRHQDDTLLTRGGGRGLRIYDDIERDCHAFAVLQKRKMAVIAREWGVEPASDSAADMAAAELVRNQLTSLAMDVPDDEILPQCSGFDQMCLNLLDALLKGFAVGEVIWVSNGSEIVASEIRARNQRRFEFTPGKRGYKLNLKTWQNLLPGEPVPPRKFIVHSLGAKDGNPYGLGLGTRLFWPTFFKRQGITFWLTFTDKFAAPTAVGNYPSGATEDQKRTLLNALSAISSEAGVIIPEGMVISLLEAARSGSIDCYEKLARYMDEQMSECVLGETGSTNQSGSGGSRARDQVGNEVRLELVKADADLLCATINSTLVKWICMLNCPTATPPKVWRDCSEPEDLKLKAERDGILSKDAGVRFSRQYFEREYSLEEGDIESIGQPDPGFDKGLLKGDTSPASFAESAAVFPDQVALDLMAGSFSAEDLQGFMEGILKPVFKLVNSGNDINAVMASLVGIYPQINTDKLEEMLTRIIFISDVWGRLNAAASD